MSEINHKDDPADSGHRGSTIGDMQTRRELMADGRRYIIYYTFGEQTRDLRVNDVEVVSENV